MKTKGLFKRNEILGLQDEIAGGIDCQIDLGDIIEHIGGLTDKQKVYLVEHTYIVVKIG